MPKKFVDISEYLDAVRKSGEFVYEEKSTEETNFLRELWSKLENAMDTLKESLKDFFDGLSPKQELSDLGFISPYVEVITWIIVVAVVLFLVFIIVKLVLHYRQTEKKEFQSLLSDIQETLNSKSWADRAVVYYQQGNYRSACRALYMAVIFFLDEKEVIKYDKAKTNFEYLQTVRSQEALYENLKPIVKTFEYLWYGEHNGTEKDYEACLAHYKQVTND